MTARSYTWRSQLYFSDKFNVLRQHVHYASVDPI
jgi:hypothetical protein